MKHDHLTALSLAAALILTACGNADTDNTSFESSTETSAPTETEALETMETSAETAQVEICEITADNFFETDPSLSEWANSGEAGDIIGLVDMDYLEASFRRDGEDTYYYGVFEIDSVEDLASLTYFVNVYPQTREGDTDYFFVLVDLLSDIDLTGLNWAPLGIGEDNSQAFRGVFVGNGHKITGLYIDNGCDDNAFFGKVTDSTVVGLYIEGAEVRGANSGIFVCSVGNSNFFDCYADGVASDNSMEGDGLFSIQSESDPNRFIDCSMNVAGASGFYYTTEEPFTMNPYPEGRSNAYLDFFNPNGDGNYDYSSDYFESRD